MKRSVLAALAAGLLFAAGPAFSESGEEKAPAAADKASEPAAGCMPGGGCCGSPACAAASAQTAPAKAKGKKKGKRAATSTCPCGRMKQAM